MWVYFVSGMVFGALLSCAVGLVVHACYEGFLPWRVRGCEKVKREVEQLRGHNKSLDDTRIRLQCELNNRLLTLVESLRRKESLEEELKSERSEKQTIIQAHAAAEADLLRVRKLLIEIGEKVNAELEP